MTKSEEEFYEMIFSTAKSAAAYACAIKDCKTGEHEKKLENEALEYLRSSYTKIFKSFPDEIESEEHLQHLILLNMKKYLDLEKD